MDSERELGADGGGETPPSRDELGAECQRYRIGEDETPSEAVTYALMELDSDDAPPLERQQPLYEVVDPDALDDLFDTNGRGDATGRVTFRYEGYEVTVRAHGEILLREVDVE